MRVALSFCMMFLAFAGLLSLPTGPAAARETIYVEAQRLPEGCQHPDRCQNRGTSLLRNIMFLNAKERNSLTLLLNRMATIRGLPPPNVIARPDPAQLHALPAADKSTPLRNHPGMYFDSSALDGNPLTAEFGKMVRETLGQAGVRFLSKEEVARIPGTPTLAVRLSARKESEGCIIPFSVSMSLTEDSVLVRNPDLKMTSTVWAGSARENLTNLHYTPRSALKEIVQKFATDWKKENG
jgi:hypothetical protein